MSRNKESGLDEADEMGEAWWQNHVRRLTEKHARQIDHNESFYAVRIQAISDLAKQHGIWDEVAAILANGKVSPEDPPTYDHMLAREKARADKAEANYRWMVERAADQRLDGYRELGAKCAALEAERDQLRAARRDYVENDDVAEGGEWEVENAHWLRIKRRAMTLLGMENDSEGGFPLTPAPRTTEGGGES